MKYSFAFISLFFDLLVFGQVPSVVPTYECAGLYWKMPEDGPCTLKYREKGNKNWKNGLDLVYDSRDGEYRGSIIGLKPNTSYQAELTAGKSDKVFDFTTRSDIFPVGRTTVLKSGITDSTVIITESGTPEAWHLVTVPTGQSSILNLKNVFRHGIEIDADYVIVRGIEIRNAQVHGIIIRKNRYNTVIEQCHITFWGRMGGPHTYGNFEGGSDSGIYGESGSGNLTIQRNLIVYPRGASNDWETGHPDGPQGISLIESSGGNVIRYNDIISSEDHGYNDGIATASTSKGPLYIFRNVAGESRVSHWNTQGGALIKTGERNEFGGGRKYVFHNTTLQPGGIYNAFSGAVNPNCISRNNIFDLPGRLVIAAAKRGTRAMGIEYNPDFVALAKENAEKAGVALMVQFIKADVFEYDFSKATVITMFLLPELNLKLRPKLLNMKPGTQILTNTFTMQDWKADETVSTNRPDDRWNKAYMWIVPAKVKGEWTMHNGDKLILDQKFQMLTGSVTEKGNAVKISSGKLKGNVIAFTAGSRTFKGTFQGNKMEGNCASGNKTTRWTAEMKSNR